MATLGNITNNNVNFLSIFLYSVKEGDADSGVLYPAVYSSSGNVDWNFPTVLRTTCSVQVQYVPWDQQACKLQFGSWSYDGGSLDVVNKSSEGDTYNFIKNGEWKLIGMFRIIKILLDFIGRRTRETID